MSEKTRPSYEELQDIDDKQDLIDLLQEEMNRWRAQGFPHPQTVQWPQIDSLCQLYAVTTLLIDKGVIGSFDEVDKELFRQKLKIMYHIYDDQIENVRRSRMGLPPDADGPMLLGPDGNPINNGNGPNV